MGLNVDQNILNNSFTPTVIGTSTAGTGTYSTQVGRYAQFGPIVVFHMHIQITNHTGTGNIQFGGLPVTSANVSNGQVACTIGYCNGLTLTASNYPKAYVLANDTKIDIVQTPTGSTLEASVPMDTAFQIIISGWYFTS